MADRKTVINGRYAVMAKNLMENMKMRNFEPYYCESTELGIEKTLELIPKGSSVSWGGSVTLVETGLLDRLETGGYNLIDREKTASFEEREAKMHEAFLCDVFVTGVNAISESGVMVDIDAKGNRVAAMAYGPKTVIVIAGMNKVVKTEDDAENRARNTAAPLTVHKMGFTKTPCATFGTCRDCKSPECLCSVIAKYRFNKSPGRIKVVLIGEDIGF
jgi:hypothetical protein